MQKVVWVALLGVTLSQAQRLNVKTASAKSVHLAWDGAGPEWTVERKSGGTYQKVGSASSPTFEDTRIDPYGTYTYRVSGGGKTSNEMTVGPPPPGVLTAAPVPAGVGEPGNYGVNSALARDENGDPVLAFVWLDPNNDGNLADTSVQFVGWDRAQYRWKKPVTVATTGDLPSKNVEPLSIACDAASGVLVIAIPAQNSGLTIAVSRDHGETWQTQLLLRSEAPPPSTAVALAGGIVHLAANTSTDVRYFSGPVAEQPAKWKSESAPKSAGWLPADGANVGLTLDAAGKPVLAWYETKEEGQGRRFVVWRPGTSPVAAVQTTLTTDFPNLALTAGAGTLGLLISQPLSAQKPDLNVWYTSSKDGATWSKPVVVPVDGPRSTNHPLSVAIDTKGRAMAAFGSNSGSEAPRCGGPMISRAADGATWVTCGPGAKGVGDFEAQPNTLHVVATGDDSMYVLWQQPIDSKAGKGLLLWHGR